jgi:hypothetical protein
MVSSVSTKSLTRKTENLWVPVKNEVGGKTSWCAATSLLGRLRHMELSIFAINFKSLSRAQVQPSSEEEETRCAHRGARIAAALLVYLSNLFWRIKICYRFVNAMPISGALSKADPAFVCSSSRPIAFGMRRVIERRQLAANPAVRPPANYVT